MNEFKPIKKHHHNTIYTGSGEVGDLSAYKSEDAIYSTWKMDSLWARVKFLFKGEVTLSVMGCQIPPVGVIMGDLIQESINAEAKKDKKC